jgi:hypothetical protein
MCHATKRFQTFREPKQMSYNVLALYVAENNVKNHLKALPKAMVGIISGRNRPGYQTHDINPHERKEVTFE